MTGKIQKDIKKHMERFNWNKLLENRCPRCQMSLEFKKDINMFDCPKCDFRITTPRFENVVENLMQRRQDMIRNEEIDEEEPEWAKAKRINETGESGEFDDI